MLGEIIGAVGGLIGGMKQNKANEKARAQEYAQQKEFAQSGIQWKVADAKAAGIHPLYALGANTVSYSPQSVGGSSFDFLGNAGQNIGRAIDSTRSNPARLEALQLTQAQVQLEGLKLDNDLKRTQIASAMGLARQPGTGPGLPSVATRPALTGMEGQGDAPQIDIEKKIAPAMPNTNYSAEAGAAPEVAFYRTNRGGYAPQVPQSLSESFEQDWPSFLQWYYRNKIVPQNPPNAELPMNHEWNYDMLSGQWFHRRTRIPDYGRGFRERYR